MKNRTILFGDVLERFGDLESESIDVVITSPPYWGLRDYGIKGQWGLEENFQEYLDKLRIFMDYVKEVLKPTGTAWINLGDSYGNNEGKSRYGITERFYAQCIDDGWIARNHIPWVKANAMPTSVKDRFQNKWESIFFFAKESKYYFNLDAVREKAQTVTKPFNIRVRENITGHAQAKLGDLSWTASDEELATHNKKGEKKQDFTLGADGKPLANYKRFNERWQKHSQLESPQGPARKNHSGYYDQDGNLLINPNGKNPGDVFFINPRPFAEAHFATFPPELPEKIIKCACPPDGWVLDPFLGSGTTALAAEKLARNWVGIEINPEYIKTITTKRLDKVKNTRLTEYDTESI